MRVLAFVAGAYFAVVQTSYFLVLEALVSSQALSYFIAVFFWLVGLLIGLWVRRDGAFLPLLGAGLASYYATLLLARAMPFASALYLVAGVSSIVSGLLPGYLFRYLGARVRPVARAFFHENNGFIVGLLLALIGATRFGGVLISFGPGALAALTAGVYVVARTP